MATGSHDPPVQRLAMMLGKLKQGESLDPRALEQEFAVNVRTIQRDINERYGYLPLEKIDGTYRMTPAFLGRLTLKPTGSWNASRRTSTRPSMSSA
jgi:predicted DNA-binding transcriptional regulator YafY